MTIQPIPLVVIIVYLLAMIGIGVYFVRRAGKSDADYLAAGKSIPGFWGGLAMASDYTSAGTMVAGLGYIVAFMGLGNALWANPIVVIGFLLVALTLGPRLRRGGYTTIPDYFAQFGSSLSLRGISAVIILFIMGVYLIVQLKAIGLVGEYVLGLPFAASLWIFGGALVVYIVLGGMFSSIWTGVVQMIVMLVAVCAVAFASISAAGGLTELVTGAAEKSPWFLTMEGKAGLEFPVTYGVIMMFIMLSMPSLLIRAHAAKNEIDARRTLIWGGFWTGIFWIPFTIVLVGVVYHVMPFKRPDMGFVVLTGKVLPSSIMVGISLAALLAACMSSTSAQLIAASSALSHDLYAKIVRANVEVPRRTIVWWDRIAALVVGIVVLIIALKPPPLVAKMLLLAGSCAGGAFLAPLYFGLYWSKVSKYSIGAGMIAGFATVIITNPMFKLLPVKPEPWCGIIGAGVSAIVLIIVTLATSNKTGTSQVKEAG
jgi:sodium/proline symporter